MIQSNFSDYVDAAMTSPWPSFIALFSWMLDVPVETWATLLGIVWLLLQIGYFVLTKIIGVEFPLRCKVALSSKPPENSGHER